MPIALVTGVMPVMFILVIAVLTGGPLGFRAALGVAAMAALIAFVFVQFLRSARDLEGNDH